MAGELITKLAYDQGYNLALQTIGLVKKANLPGDYQDVLANKEPIDIAAILSHDPSTQQDIYNQLDDSQFKSSLIGGGLGLVGGGGLGALLGNKGGRSLGGSILGGRGLTTALGALLGGATGLSLGKKPGRAKALERILPSTGEE